MNNQEGTPQAIVAGNHTCLGITTIMNNPITIMYSDPISSSCKVSFPVNTPFKDRHGKKLYDFTIPHVTTLDDVLHVMECDVNLPKDCTVTYANPTRPMDYDNSTCVETLVVVSSTGVEWMFTFKYEFLSTLQEK